MNNVLMAKPKMNAVLLIFFLCLSIHVTLCKNRQRSKMMLKKDFGKNFCGFTSYQSSSSAMKRFVSSDIGIKLITWG